MSCRGRDVCHVFHKELPAWVGVGMRFYLSSPGLTLVSVFMPQTSTEHLLCHRHSRKQDQQVSGPTGLTF